MINDYNESRVIGMYLNDAMSANQISKLLKCDVHKITKTLKRNGIPLRPNRKYSVDECFFDVIDTEIKAYILGFLYADGYNGISKGTISLSLQEDDFEILERIRCEIKSEKPLEYIDYSNKHNFGYSYKNQYRLLIHSMQMCKSLENIGMVSNKSLVLKYPDIKDDLSRHFIRGYFDGDGSIYRQIKNENNHAITVTITSTSDFCNTLYKICEKQIRLKSHIYDSSCHNGVTKVFTLSGRNVSRKFLDWIYTESNIRMDRKYNRYLEYFYGGKNNIESEIA